MVQVSNRTAPQQFGHHRSSSLCDPQRLHVGHAMLLVSLSSCSSERGAPESNPKLVAGAGGWSTGSSSNNAASGSASIPHGGIAVGGSAAAATAGARSTTNQYGTGATASSGGTTSKYVGVGAVGNNGNGFTGSPAAGGMQSAAGNANGTRVAGGATVGGASNGESSSLGGARATGGRTNSGALGGAISGGVHGLGGATARSTGGGFNRSGGASGNASAAGGGTPSAGAANDRCNLGIYDAAAPPRALTLSGALGVHDPSAIESDGSFYLFATGVGAKTSKSLAEWVDAPRPFAAPAWAQTAVPGVTDLWAADISYFGGKYHLYYSASTFGSNRSCIGHASKAALNVGAWLDQGSATICSNVNSTDDWNAIDPAVVEDETGKNWLVFGSFWGGIKLIELDPNGARVGTALTALAARPKNGGALEGPYIVRRCGYYYLFTSWDSCCKGANSTYNIRVGRSTSVTGPYVDKVGTALLQGGGTLIAQTGGNWAGPGGQSVMISGNNAYLVYHAYATSDGTATLRIAELVWDTSGWPVSVGP